MTAGTFVTSFSCVSRRLFFRPDDCELDEFHPKSSRTLFVGNLPPSSLSSPSSQATLVEQLKERFSTFGDILDVDAKLKGSHALVQFSDVSAVAKAIRRMDGQPLNTSSSSSPGGAMRLAFAKMVPAKCVWCQGLGDGVTDSWLRTEFGRFGKIQDVIVDAKRGQALIYFDQVRSLSVVEAYAVEY